jgi:hypothetical protein
VDIIFLYTTTHPNIWCSCFMNVGVWVNLRPCVLSHFCRKNKPPSGNENKDWETRVKVIM